MTFSAAAIVIDGSGVDLVVDPTGGSAFGDAMRAVATGGRMLAAEGQRRWCRLGEFVNRMPGAQEQVGAALARLVDDGHRLRPCASPSEGMAAV